MTAKICLITGASSGIGRATALELARAGHIVYGAARRVHQVPGGHALAMDVTNPADVERAVRTVLDEQHRIDVLVNNAGIGLYGAVEDVPLDRARHLFDVNLFGVAHLTRLVLPHMRERGSGSIVNVSSIAGEISLPLGGWYHASKHALEALTDSLRQEVEAFGIDVALIQPGLIKTEFEQDIREISGQGAYRDLAQAMARRAEASKGGADPAVVATAIRKAVESTHPKPRHPVGHLARTVLWLNRLLPDRAFDRLVTKR